MRRWTLLLALVLAACSGGDERSSGSTEASNPTDTVASSLDTVSTDSAPPDTVATDLPLLEEVTTPAWAPATRSDELGVAIDEAQQVTLQMAVDAAALLDPEFPGSTPTTLPLGDGLGVGYTLWLIEQFRDHLTPEQVAVLDRLLDADPIATVTRDGDVTMLSDEERELDTDTTATEGFAGRRVAAQSAEAIEARYVRLLKDVLNRYDTRHPGLLDGIDTFELFFAQTRFVGENDIGAMAASLTRPGVCGVRVGRFLWGSVTTDRDLLVFYAHEVFHCYQNHYIGGFRAPKWVREGGADWFAYDLFRNEFSPKSTVVFFDWFESTGTQLRARWYDAWPLYEMALRFGLDPLEVMREQWLLPRGSSTATYLTKGGLDRLSMRLDWVSRTTRMTTSSDPSWNFAWIGPDTTYGPRDNAIRAPEKGIGRFRLRYAGKWIHPSFDIPMKSEVGLVTVFTGADALMIEAGGRTITVAASDSVRLCLMPDQCRCPGGASPNAVPVSERVLTFSMPAREKETAHQIRNQKWDPKIMCSQDEDPRTGRSNGDPHLETFDGVVYDSMTLGEFVYARDPEGGFEIHGRHVSASLPGAASTSAVAVSDGEHRITFTYHEEGPDARPVVRADGVEVDERVFQVGDLAVGENEDGETTVTWPDGSSVELDSTVGWWFFDVHAMPERAARLEGLLGSGDWDLRNDLRMPDGTIVEESATDGTEAPHTLAWQVDEGTTLFDYVDGESVDHFRVAHPDPEPIEPSDGDVQRCADALGPEALESEIDWCAYDVAASEYDEELVQIYVVVVDQRVADAPEFDDEILLPPETTLPTGPDAQPGQEGAPTARLEGLLAASYSPEVDAGRAIGQLDASVEAVEGTVLLVRTPSCDTDTIVFMTVTLRETGAAAFPFLCDPSRLANPPGDEDDEAVVGESFVWISTGGVYDIALTSDSEQPLAIAAEVFVDPTPTIVGSDDLDGASVELSGIGDTVVFETGLDASSYTIEGLDQACGIVAYGAPAPGEAGPWALSHCVHTSDVVAPGNAGLVIPLIVWNREDRTVTVEVAQNPS